MLWLVNLDFAAGGTVTPPQPEPAPTTQTPAGSSRTRRKRRYQVEIDGQVFEARDQDHALEILAHARALAERAAQAKADDIVRRATPRVVEARVVKPVALKTPALRAPDELTQAAQETRIAIERAYQSASIAAELRLLLALAQEQEDDEDDVLLLLN